MVLAEAPSQDWVRSDPPSVLLFEKFPGFLVATRGTGLAMAAAAMDFTRLMQKSFAA